MANPYYNFTSTFIPQTKVRSDDMNTELDDITSGFDLLPGVGDAITRGVTYLGIESGSVNTYTVTMPDTRTAYAEGDRVAFRATHTNTGPSVINIDTIGAVAAVRTDDTALESGDIILDVYYEFIYDSVSSHFQMLNQPGSYIADMDNRVDWAEEWAIEPEDSLVSTAAGGDGVSDYSALHWAAKASADAAAADADAIAAAASAAAAAASAATIDLPNPIGNAYEFLQVNAGATAYENVDFRAESISWTGNHDYLVAAGTVGNTLKPADASGDGAFNGLLIRHSDSTYRGFFGSIPGDGGSYFCAYTWDTTLGTPAWNRALGANPDCKTLQLLSTGMTYDGVPVMTELLTDTSPVLGGDLDGGGFDIELSSTEQLRIGNGTAPTPALAFTASATSGIYRLGSGNYGFSSNSTLKLQVSSDVTVHAELAVQDGTVTVPGIYFEDDPNTGFYRPSADVLAVAAGGKATCTFTGGTGDDDYLDIKSADAGSSENVELSTAGTSTDVTLDIKPKGAGILSYNGDEVTTHATQTAKKNILINGAMQIWQDMRTRVGITNGARCADMWKYGFNGSAVQTMARIAYTGAVLPAGIDWYTRFQVTTADTVLSGVNHVHVFVAVEGRDWAGMHWGLSNAKEVTLGFWTGHTLTGVYCVSFRNSASNRSYVAEYTQAVADTWQYNEVTVPGDTGGAWQTASLAGVRIGFTMANGTTYDAPAANTWYAANYVATTNQVNHVSSASVRYFRLAGVNLVQGSYAPPIEVPYFADALARCQRYWAKSWDYDTNIGTATIQGCDRLYKAALPSALHTGSVAIKFPVPMASSPTMTIYSTSTGASGKIRDTVNAADVNALLPGTESQHSSDPYGTMGTAGVSVNFQAQWIADADL
jgi:hypothetical protein